MGRYNQVTLGGTLSKKMKFLAILPFLKALFFWINLLENQWRLILKSVL